jgi:transcriptional regulator with XRE-family HTH domain
MRAVAIHERIRKERVAAGLTQEHCARLFGVTQRHWSMWELGERRVVASAVPAIAKILGVTIARLYGEQRSAIRPGTHKIRAAN